MFGCTEMYISIQRHFDQMQTSILHYCLILILLVGFTQKVESQSSSNKIKPVTLSSGLTLQARFYQTNTSALRQSPFAFVISGTPRISIYGYDIPLRFVFSNQQSQFHQPFNQFGLAPQIKWAKFYLGHNNIRFSDHTLNGRKVLGAGFELRPGLLRLGFIYGRFQKAIAEDLVPNSDEDAFLIRRPRPTFEQRGFAAKVGYGSENNFIDLILVKIHDRPESIVAPEASDIKPQENLVLGVLSKVTLFNKITWDLDVGLSAFTQNTQSDTISINHGLASKLTKLFVPRESTSLHLAGKTGIHWASKGGRLGLQYRRVDPGYRTLAAYFFQSDLEEYSATGLLRLAKNTIVMNGKVGWLRNNIYELSNAKSTRGIAILSLQWRPNDLFQLSSSYSNYGLQRDAFQQISLVDSFRIKQVSRSIHISPAFHFGNTTMRHQFQITYHLSQLSDLAPFPQTINENRNTLWRIAYTFTRPQKIMLTPQFLYNQIQSRDQSLHRLTIGLAYRQFFKNSQASLGLQGNVFRDMSDGNLVRQGSLLSMQGTIPITDEHSIQVQTRWLHSASDAQRRSEFFTTLSYALSF